MIRYGDQNFWIKIIMNHKFNGSNGWSWKRVQNLHSGRLNSEYLNGMEAKVKFDE